MSVDYCLLTLLRSLNWCVIRADQVYFSRSKGNECSIPLRRSQGQRPSVLGLFAFVVCETSCGCFCTNLTTDTCISIEQLNKRPGYSVKKNSI